MLDGKTKYLDVNRFDKMVENNMIMIKLICWAMNSSIIKFN